MSLITWSKEQYGTGVSIADEQHQKLFDLLNVLHGDIPGGDKTVIGNSLDSLLNYVVEHFQTEERLMQEKKYSDYDAHKAEHDALIEKCTDLKSKFLAGEQDITTDTTVFIKDWLDTHIPNIDRLYTPTLNS